MIPEAFFDPTVPLWVPKRYRHSVCSEGKDKALIITRIEDGWIYKCHRCGKKGIKPLAGISPRKYQLWQKHYDAKPYHTVSTIELPPDFTQKIPAKGLSWLYKNGADDQDILKWKFGYSPGLDRVILPVINRQDLMYWQGRYLGIPDKVKYPKYINVSRHGRDSVYFWNDQSKEDQIVLVEDILSAVKVGHCCDSVALLYAYVPDDLVFNLSQVYPKIYLWLDWDKNHEVLDRVKRFRTFGVNCKCIMTPKDPKKYDEDFILEQIERG